MKQKNENVLIVKNGTSETAIFFSSKKSKDKFIEEAKKKGKDFAPARSRT